MIKIIKRLELIKTAIALEDEEIIELQVMKLNNIEYDTKIEQILVLISDNRYEQVINLIDTYIEGYNGVIIDEDPQIQGLKVELKILEKKLQNLNEEKSEYTHIINDFNAQSNLKLGDLIREILRLRKELSYDRMGEFLDNDEKFEEAANQYEQQKQEYEEFSEDYIEQIKEIPFELTEDESKELKQTYRKASRLCHPDLVTDDVKKQAEEVFKALNEAYTNNDLEEVKKILEDLEFGNAFERSSESLNDKKALKIKIEALRTKIDVVADEIHTIKEEETFQTISEIDNWDEYFYDLKEQLKEELNELIQVEDNQKKSVKDVEQASVFSNLNEEKDDYWEIPF